MSPPPPALLSSRLMPVGQVMPVRLITIGKQRGNGALCKASSSSRLGPTTFLRWRPVTFYFFYTLEAHLKHLYKRYKEYKKPFSSNFDDLRKRNRHEGNLAQIHDPRFPGNENVYQWDTILIEWMVAKVTFSRVRMHVGQNPNLTEIQIYCISLPLISGPLEKEMR